MNKANIPFTEFSITGKLLHFAHANGYHPRAYQPLLNTFTEQYHVLAMHLRPLWGNASPEAIRDWEPFTQDLLAFLETHSQSPVIGVGHSIGATISLMAALKQPQRFKALVLFDPVIFPPWMGLYWKIAVRAGLANHLHPLTKRTLKRRQIFPSREAMFASYRKKPVFKFISDQNLRIMIDALTFIDNNGNAVLKYPPVWEARIYATGILRDWYIWKNIHAFRVPLLIIYSSNSNAFWKSSAKRIRRLNPAVKLIRMDETSHLLPMEKPILAGQHANQFLEILNAK